MGLWLNELKEIAYEADDILDEMSTEVLRSHSQVQGFFSSFIPSKILFQFEIASRIDEVIEKLEEIAKEKEDLHLKEEDVVMGHRARNERLQTGSLVDEHIVCGRAGDRERLISLLLCDGNNETRL